MTSKQYLFSFALATLSFIAAKSIQKEGVQDYFDKIADAFQEEIGAIDFERASKVAYLPMGLQPLTALVQIDSTRNMALSQDSLQVIELDSQLQRFAPVLQLPQELKMQQLASFDSTLVLLDTEQRLHFLTAPYAFSTERLFTLPTEEDVKHLITYHPNLKRLVVFNSLLLENGKRRFTCKLLHTSRLQLSQMPLYSFDTEEILFEPISIAVQPQSNEFYLLSESGEVVVLGQNGEIIKRAQLPSGLSQPKIISFSYHGDLIVTDADNLHPAVMRLEWQKMLSKQGAFIH
jgi:hypothetical protein